MNRIHFILTSIQNQRKQTHSIDKRKVLKKILLDVLTIIYHTVRDFGPEVPRNEKSVGTVKIRYAGQSCSRNPYNRDPFCKSDTSYLSIDNSINIHSTKRSERSNRIHTLRAFIARRGPVA